MRLGGWCSGKRDFRDPDAVEQIEDMDDPTVFDLLVRANHCAKILVLGLCGASQRRDGFVVLDRLRIHHRLAVGG